MLGGGLNTTSTVSPIFSEPDHAQFLEDTVEKIFDLTNPLGGTPRKNPRV